MRQYAMGLLVAIQLIAGVATADDALDEVAKNEALPSQTRSKIRSYQKAAAAQNEKFREQEEQQRQRFLGQLKKEASKLKKESEAATAATKFIEALAAGESAVLADPDALLPSNWVRPITRFREDAIRREDMHLKRTRSGRERLLSQMGDLRRKSKDKDAATNAAYQIATALAKAELPARFKSGLICYEYPRHKKQKGEKREKTFVDEKKLGEPAGVQVRQFGGGSMPFGFGRNLFAKGHFLIPKAGKHKFTVTGHRTGGARLIVGRTEIKQEDGKGGKTVRLSRGLTQVVVVGRLASGKVDIKWQPPGEKEPAAIPFGIVYHDSWAAAGKLKEDPNDGEEDTEYDGE